MQIYKKRARLLSEKTRGALTYGNDNSLVFNYEDNQATFVPISKHEMNCEICIAKHSANYVLSKKYIFDIIDNASTKHLAETLLEYEKKPILTISDYINEEGSQFFNKLQQKITTSPNIDIAYSGGNRIRIEYYFGVFIITDDLLFSATNVVTQQTV